MALSFAFGSVPAYALRDQQRAEGTKSGLEEIVNAFLTADPRTVGKAGTRLASAVGFAPAAPSSSAPLSISPAASGLEEEYWRVEGKPWEFDSSQLPASIPVGENRFFLVTFGSSLSSGRRPYLVKVQDDHLVVLGSGHFTWFTRHGSLDRDTVVLQPNRSWESPLAEGQWVSLTGQGDAGQLTLQKNPEAADGLFSHFEIYPYRLERGVDEAGMLRILHRWAEESRQADRKGSTAYLYSPVVVREVYGELALLGRILQQRGDEGVSEMFKENLFFIVPEPEKHLIPGSKFGSSSEAKRAMDQSKVPYIYHANDTTDFDPGLFYSHSSAFFSSDWTSRLDKVQSILLGVADYATGLPSGHNAAFLKLRDEARRIALFLSRESASRSPAPAVAAGAEERQLITQETDFSTLKVGGVIIHPDGTEWEIQAVSVQGGPDRVLLKIGKVVERFYKYELVGRYSYRPPASQAGLEELGNRINLLPEAQAEQASVGVIAGPEDPRGWAYGV
ncbi:MAG: hypothetical protein HYZ93_05150, partial [Candidatus Omnitrophica bacterium]|nr:hypothetical protein [Candidatus Omnitrophota bacterium]